MLNVKNIKTKRLFKKLNKKILGPFKVKKVIFFITLKLILLKVWIIYDTFYVSFIEPYYVNN